MNQGSQKSSKYDAIKGNKAVTTNSQEIEMYVLSKNSNNPPKEV